MSSPKRYSAPPGAASSDQREAYIAIICLSVVFFIGLLVSGLFFYAGRRFDWTAAIISDLQSPEENPRGYLASALATAITSFFFFRLAAQFHRWSRAGSVWRARMASSAFGLGAFGALAIGCLAPFPVSYEAVHVPLAFATFFCLVAGLGGHLLLAALRFWRTERRRSLPLVGGCVMILGVLAALAWTYRVPNFFTGDSLWTTLALWEWLLCASIVGFMLLLTQAHSLTSARSTPSCAGRMGSSPIRQPFESRPVAPKALPPPARPVNFLRQLTRLNTLSQGGG